MDLVIRKLAEGYTMNGVPASEDAVKVVLTILIQSPQLDRCVKALENLDDESQIVFKDREADAEPAVEEVRQEAEAAMRAIIKANNAICELLVRLGNTTPALNEHIAVLHGIAQEGK